MGISCIFDSVLNEQPCFFVVLGTTAAVRLFFFFLDFVCYLSYVIGVALLAIPTGHTLYRVLISFGEKLFTLIR